MRHQEEQIMLQSHRCAPASVTVLCQLKKRRTLK